VAWWTSGTLVETIHALQYNGYGDDDNDDDEVDDPSSNEIHTMDQGNVIAWILYVRFQLGGIHLDLR
jgi:hypothetical protein